MKDSLLIISRIKKTIYYLDKIVDNFPLKEMVIRDNLKRNIFDLLETAYLANTFEGEQREYYQRILIVKIRTLDFYIQLSCDKKLINHKKYEKIGNHLLEITRLTYGWIKNNEASK